MRGFTVIVGAVAVLAVAALAPACSSGGDDRRASPPATTTPTGGPVSPPATGGTGGPCKFGSALSDGYLPEVRLSPSPVAVGERVSVSGAHFTGRCWGYPPGLETIFLFGPGGPPGCELVAQIDAAARVDRHGTVTGRFSVPPRGFCRQDPHVPPRQPPLTQGTYSVAMGCTACTVGRLVIEGG